MKKKPAHANEDNTEKKKNAHKTNITKWLEQNSKTFTRTSCIYTQPIHKFHFWLYFLATIKHCVHADTYMYYIHSQGNNAKRVLSLFSLTLRLSLYLTFPCSFCNGFIVVSSFFSASFEQQRNSTRHAQWIHFFLVHFTFFCTIFFSAPALHISSGHNTHFKCDINKATSTATMGTTDDDDEKI